MPESTEGEAQSREQGSRIEEGTELAGSLVATSPVLVHGSIEGELLAPRLEVTETGRVEGKLEAKQLISRGKLSGQVVAEDLTLSGTLGAATVVRADRLTVALSRNRERPGLILGECTFEVGEEPARRRQGEPMPRASLVAPGVSLLPSTAPRAICFEDEPTRSARESAPPEA